MSQFQAPPVNFLDPVTPSTAQGTAVASQNLQQNANRGMEARRMAMEAQQSADRLKFESEESEKNRAEAEKLQKQQGEVDIQKQQMMNQSFQDVEKEQTSRAMKLQQAQEVIEQQRMAMQKSLDDRVYQTDRKDRVENLKIAKGQAAADAAYHTAQLSSQEKMANMMIEGIRIKQGLDMTGPQFAAKLLSVHSTTQQYSSQVEEAGSQGMQASTLADHDLGAWMQQFAQAEDIGISKLPGIAEVALQAKRYLREGVGLSPDTSEVPGARTIPEVGDVAEQAADTYAGGFADYFASQGGAKNPDVIKGAFKGLLLAGGKKAPVLAALDKDDEGLAELDKTFGDLAPYVKVLTDNKVPLPAVSSALNGFMSSVQNRIQLQKEKMEGVTRGPNGEIAVQEYDPYQTERARDSRLLEGLTEVSKWGATAAASMKGKVPDVASAQAITLAIEKNIFQDADEDVQQTLAAYFKDHPEIAQDVSIRWGEKLKDVPQARALRKQIAQLQGQMQNLASAKEIQDIKGEGGAVGAQDAALAQMFDELLKGSQVPTP